MVVAGIPDPLVSGKNGVNDLENSRLIPDLESSTKSAPIWFPKDEAYYLNGLPHTLHVNYSVASERFPTTWIPPGHPIPDTSLIFKCWESGENKTGEIAAAELGSSSPLKYFVECRPFQANGKPAVLALLWLHDKQLDLNISAYAGW